LRGDLLENARGEKGGPAEIPKDTREATDKSKGEPKKEPAAKSTKSLPKWFNIGKKK
jgi:hypothetical protein